MDFELSQNIWADKGILTRDMYLDLLGSARRYNVARVCLHADTESDLHVMCIAMKKGVVYSEHYHPHKEEIYFLLRGALALSLDRGIEKVLLDKRGCLSFRMDKMRLHRVEAISPYVIFLEITKGPYDKNLSTKYLDN